MPRAIRITSASGALTVNVTGPAGNTPVVYADSQFSAATSLPATIGDGATSTLWLKSPGAYTLSVKTSSGTEIAGDNNQPRIVDLETDGTVAALSYDTRFTHRIEGDSGRGSDTGDTNAASVVPAVALHAPTGIAATDTANLYQAINDTPVGGRLWIPSSATYYAYDPSIQQLAINKSMTIEGDAIAGDYNASISPQYPYMHGSVIQVVTAGYDGLQITGTAISVNLKRLGILFSNGLASTGHGINALPAVAGSYFAGGIEDFVWEQLMIANHDGDHYGFSITNPTFGTMNALRSYGGGGLYVRSSSAAHNYGNIVNNHLSIYMMKAGSAHGVAHDSVTAGGTQLDMLTYIRPQVECNPGVNNSQLLWNDTVSGSSPVNVNIVAIDLETSGTQAPAFGSKTTLIGDPFITPANVFNKTWTSFGNGAFPYNGTATGAAFGQNALAAATTGLNNAAVGPSALTVLQSGSKNTAVGSGAARLAVTASDITAVGAFAAEKTTVTATAVGSGALNALTSGTNNTAIGVSALLALTTTGNMTAIGQGSAAATVTGSNSVAVGFTSLAGAFTNSQHVAVGNFALQNYAGTGTGSNTAVGFAAMSGLTASGNNTAVGYNAGVTATAGNKTTTGAQQTLVGMNSGQSTATQLTSITCLGYQALAGGNNALALGASTSAGAAGAVAIGTDSAGTGASSATANLIVFGTANHTTQIPGLPAFVSGDKYLVVDSSGNVHKSALGPAS